MEINLKEKIAKIFKERFLFIVIAIYYIVLFYLNVFENREPTTSDLLYFFSLVIVHYFTEINKSILEVFEQILTLTTKYSKLVNAQQDILDYEQKQFKIIVDGLEHLNKNQERVYKATDEIFLLMEIDQRTQKDAYSLHQARLKKLIADFDKFESKTENYLNYLNSKISASENNIINSINNQGN